MFKGTQQFGTSNYEAEKPLLDQIEQLFEVYRKTTDDAERAAIYRQIDSISYEAYEIRHPQRVRQTDVGDRRSGNQRQHLDGPDGLYRKHSFEPDRELGQDPGRPLQERRDPRIPHRARNDLRGEKHVPDGRQSEGLHHDRRSALSEPPLRQTIRTRHAGTPEKPVDYQRKELSHAVLRAQ